MPDFLRTLYACYLGKSKGIRMQAIAYFIINLEAEWFFRQYSTSTDSIMDFLNRIRRSGLEIK